MDHTERIDIAALRWLNTASAAFERSAAVAVLAVLLLVTVVWTISLSSSHLHEYDAFDYAQIGRQIASGHGMTSLQIFPREVSWLKAHGYTIGNALPNLHRPPLTPIAVAVTNLVVPDIERASVVQSGLWMLLAAAVVYLLVDQLDNRLTALLSVLAFIGDGPFWGLTHDGMSESLAILLILTTACLTFSKSPSRARALALGALCGLGYLCRNQLVFLLPWALALVFLQDDWRTRHPTSIVVAFAATISPWLIRNLLVAGDPFFSFFNSRNLVMFALPRNYDLELQLFAPVSLGGVLHLYGGAIASKVWHNLWPNLLNPLALTSGRIDAGLLVISFIALVYLARRRADKRQRRTLLFIAGATGFALINFMLASLVELDSRYIELADPLVIIAGIVGASVLLDRLGDDTLRDFAKAGLFATSVIAFGWLCAEHFIGDLRHRPLPNADRHSYALLSQMSRGRGVVASDASAHIALYAGLPAIRLPSNPRQLLEIDKQYMPIDYVVLTTGVLRQPGHDMVSNGYLGYASFRSSEAFRCAFELSRVLPNGAEVYARRLNGGRRPGTVCASSFDQSSGTGPVNSISR